MPLLACVSGGGGTGHYRGCARIYKRITYAQCPPVESAEIQPVTNAPGPLSRRPPARFFRGLAPRRDSIVITTCTIWHAFFPGGCSLAPGSALSSLPASQGFKVSRFNPPWTAVLIALRSAGTGHLGASSVVSVFFPRKFLAFWVVQKPNSRPPKRPLRTNVHPGLCDRHNSTSADGHIAGPSLYIYHIRCLTPGQSQEANQLARSPLRGLGP